MRFRPGTLSLLDLPRNPLGRLLELLRVLGPDLLDREHGSQLLERQLRDPVRRYHL
jgi:hypothetical protein